MLIFLVLHKIAPLFYIKVRKEFRLLGGDAAQIRLIDFPIEIGVRIVGGGVHIEGRVDAYRDHPHNAAPRRFFSSLR